MKARVQPHIEFWKTVKHSEIVNYFHKWSDDDTKQYKRVHHYELTDLDRFNELEEITKINICLAIDETISGFRAYPVLEVWTNSVDEPEYFNFEGKVAPNSITPPTSDVVPGIFKEMISRNWQTLDTGLINDLFVAQKEPAEDENFAQLVRVHHFWLSDKMKDHINLLRQSNQNMLNGIMLYPGVDLNKYADKKMISFTPVLGIVHNDSIPGMLSFPFHGGDVGVDLKETFIEYTCPCPPTCRKESPSSNL